MQVSIKLMPPGWECVLWAHIQQPKKCWVWSLAFVHQNYYRSHPIPFPQVHNFFSQMDRNNPSLTKNACSFGPKRKPQRPFFTFYGTCVYSKYMKCYMILVENLKAVSHVSWILMDVCAVSTYFPLSQPTHKLFLSLEGRCRLAN